MKSQNKNALMGSQGANSFQQNSHAYSTSPINLLLDRLENVKPAGEGYRACCPAHESKSRNTLTIKPTDDGRVLLHCFSSCSALEVVHALGLEMKDLFPRQDYHRMTPQQKREIREKARQAGWKTALELLPLEIAVIEIAAVQLSKGKPLNLADHKRLELAGKRISSARQVLCGS